MQDSQAGAIRKKREKKRKKRKTKERKKEKKQRKTKKNKYGIICAQMRMRWREGLERLGRPGRLGRLGTAWKGLERHAESWKVLEGLGRSWGSWHSSRATLTAAWRSWHPLALPCQSTHIRAMVSAVLRCAFCGWRCCDDGWRRTLAVLCNPVKWRSRSNNWDSIAVVGGSSLGFSPLFFD